MPLSSPAMDVPRLQDHMVWIPGGSLVDGFWIDATAITNGQPEVRRGNGLRHVAEIAPAPADHPGARLGLLKAGRLVFTAPKHSADLADWSRCVVRTNGGRHERPEQEQ